MLFISDGKKVVSSSLELELELELSLVSSEDGNRKWIDNHMITRSKSNWMLKPNRTVGRTGCLSNNGHEKRHLDATTPLRSWIVSPLR
mmetsp:Transcript_35182/g.39578  ORF Transcript_35182/g.39578 Transcript_35182/m.39578 type:complete len:88 (+) Transcript_35182:356-619(+)